MDNPVMIRNGAMITLTGLLRQNKHMNINAQSNHFLSLSQLAVQLQCWLPLSGSSSNNNNNNTDPLTATAAAKHARQAKEETNNSIVPDEAKRSNARGLERWFTIWNTAFEAEQVFVSQEDGGANNNNAKDATTCLVLLAKMSLDCSLHSTEM